ncbi:hypothetical protein N9240_02435 [Akkermansiaceae bacterium]|nr:hypothetical protein [Akkermansiaceae bacterium]
MKMTSDDPRLTAYALGELPKSDHAIVEAAIANQPELGQELAKLSGLRALLKDTLGGESFHLGEERHEEIFKSGKRPDGKVIVMENRKKLRRQSFLAIVGVAAVVTFGFYLLSKTTVESPGGVAGNEEVEGDSQVAGGADVSEGGLTDNKGLQESEAPRESHLPRPLSTEQVFVTDLTALRLPLRVNRAHLSAYERSLSMGQNSEIRAEEWINAGEYTFDSDVAVAGVGVSAELGACPWDTKKNLLLVMLKDLKSDGVAPQITGNLLLENGCVKTARLVATRDVSGEIAKVQTMDADTSVALLYELELLPGEGRVAAIDLEVITGNDSKNGLLPILGVAEEASLNYETAVTLARFAKREFDDELPEIADAARALLGKVSESQARYALDLILLTADAKK